MPNLLRVKCYYVFSDLKTFFYSADRFIHEIRRFSLEIEDKSTPSSTHTLYEQLLKNVQITFRSFSPGLVSDGQPFRLYWKDNDGEFIAFYSQRELLEATYAMTTVGTPVVTTVKSSETQRVFLTANSLKIHVLVLDKMAAENTNPSALFVDLSYPTSSAATSAATAATNTSSTASTQSLSSCSSTTSATTPPTPASPSEIKAVQEIKAAPAAPAAPAAAASAPAQTEASSSDEINAVQEIKAAPTETEPPSSDESSKDEFDVIKMQKEFV